MKFHFATRGKFNLGAGKFDSANWYVGWIYSPNYSTLAYLKEKLHGK